MTKIINNFTDPPVLRLKYGHAVKARHIREGSDVYFECQVTSNPPITVGRLHWFRGVSKSSIFSIRIRSIAFVILDQIF